MKYGSRWRRQLTAASCLAGVSIATPAQAADKIQVVCVGDSITNRGAAALEYPTYVQETLGADFEVSNCGHNGALLTNQPSRAGDYYPATKEFQACKQAVPAPDVVTIMLGTNDSGYWAAAQASYLSEYQQLIAGFQQANPRVKVVTATSPSAVGNWRGLIKGAVVRDEIAPLVHMQAEQHGYVLADVNHETMGWVTGPDLSTYDMTKFADDGVHPNEAGARAIAEVFVKAIQVAIAPEPTQPEPSGGAAGAAGAGGMGGAAGAGGLAGNAAIGGAAAAGSGTSSGGSAGAALAGGAATPLPTGGSPESNGGSAAGSANAATASTTSSDSSCSYAARAEQRLGVASVFALLGCLLGLRRRRA